MKRVSVRLNEEHHAMLIKQSTALGLTINAYLKMIIIKLDKGE